MCGRYNIIDDPAIRDLLAYLGIRQQLQTTYNIAPTEMVPVIRQGEAAPELSWMRWWLVPSWAKEPSTKYSMFNARAEGLSESRAFRHPFKRQRCVLPASSFIEWRKEDGKQPYEIRMNAEAFAFAGIWESWGEGAERIYSCALITTGATPAFRHIHTRMPVMLDREVLLQWLNPEIEGRALIAHLMPHVPGPLKVVPVDSRINNSRIKEMPQAIAPEEIID